MSYQIHIEREEGTISETAWQRAVESVEGVRMASGEPKVMKNPMTGEEMSIPSPSTDAELLFPEDSLDEGMQGQWVPIFQYSRPGAIQVNAAFDFEDPNDPVRKTIKALADRLGAVIVGDEGEVYDF